MKATLFKIRHMFFLLLFAGLGATAQDYSKVDATVKNYPSSYSGLDKLATQIGKDFKSEDEKARALFTWIAYNVRYDNSPAAMGRKPLRYSYSTEEERRAKVAAIENDLASTTLRTKKGVCHGYAMLYTVVARKLGLQSEVVHGNAKALPDDIGKLPANSNHAWNVVKINGQWKLVDVTWGAGGITNGSRNFTFNFDDNYFFTQPEVFFLNHFPADKKWLLTGKDEAEYASLPLYYDLAYELISPSSGIIKTGTNKLTNFKIKGLKPSDDITYQYSSGKYSNKVLPTIKSGVGEFNLALDTNATGTLTIFVNKKSVAAYKLN